MNKGFDDSPPSPGGGGGGGGGGPPTGHHNNATISQIVLNPNYTKTLPLLSSVSAATSGSGKQDLNYHIRQVRNSLKHFNDVVAKNKLEMLPGNGTVILDNLTDVHTALQAYALNERSSALISAKRQIYEALGKLIKLCDEFWLHEVKFKPKTAKVLDAASVAGPEASASRRVSSEEKQMRVKEVTESMEAALSNLIQVSHEKLQEQNAAKGAFPVGLITDQNENLLQRPVDVASQRTSLPDIPLTPRERDILQSKANNHNLVRGSHSIESVLCDSKNCNANVMRGDSPSPVPPPKPPLPNRLSDAPPLPPKRKNLQLHQQFSHPAIAANLEAEFMAPLERMSWRSKSPEDNSSLLSVSAGSLDSSTLNQSREEEEEDLFESDQLAGSSSSKSPSQYQYQPLEETTSVTVSTGRLPTVSVTGAGGDGATNGNDSRCGVFNGELTTTIIGSNNTIITETSQRTQNTFTQSISSSSLANSVSRTMHQQTLSSRTQFQTLYSSANVRVRVLPLSVSQDGFLATSRQLQQQQQHFQQISSMVGGVNGQLTSQFVADSCTLSRIAAREGEDMEQKVLNVQEGGEAEDEEPPKLPEKQRKNSNRDRHKSVYDNMSPTKGQGTSSNCDSVDGTVELRDK